MGLGWVKIPPSSLFFIEIQPYFLSKYSLNYCKLLVDCQCSKSVDSDKFFSFSIAFMEGQNFYSAIFADISFFFFFFLSVFLMVKVSLIWLVGAFLSGSVSIQHVLISFLLIRLSLPKPWNHPFSKRDPVAFKWRMTFRTKTWVLSASLLLGCH